MLAEGGHQKDLTTGQAISWLLHLVYREQAYHLEFYVGAGYSGILI